VLIVEKFEMERLMNSDFLKMKRLFLKQSYIDAWELYADSMEDENACLWDYIILTASNEL